MRKLSHKTYWMLPSRRIYTFDSDNDNILFKNVSCWRFLQNTPVCLSWEARASQPSPWNNKDLKGLINTEGISLSSYSSERSLWPVWTFRPAPCAWFPVQPIRSAKPTPAVVYINKSSACQSCFQHAPLPIFEQSFFLTSRSIYFMQKT